MKQSFSSSRRFGKTETSPPPSRSHTPSSVSCTSIPLGYSSSYAPFREPMDASTKRTRYLRKLFKFHQMDFQFAAWQMIYLFIAPQKVFRNFQYRKQTKAQFARDDPAFVVLLCFWLCVTSAGFAVILRLGFINFLWFIIYSIFVDTLIIGIIVASVLWIITNHFLKKPTCRDKDVEWGYAFDVHLNAYFPPLLILHLFMLCFYHVFISHELFISCCFGNLLWATAVFYYVYITFLGYSALPILHRTRVFFFSLPVFAIFFLMSIIGQWNLCVMLVNFYKMRVVI